MKLLLWCVLLVVCWPLALVVALLYPVVWLLLLPFRIVGIAVGGVLELMAAVIFLPVRVLRGPRRLGAYAPFPWLKMGVWYSARRLCPC